METFFSWFGPIYANGFIYTVLASIVISFLFAFWRWYGAVKQYIETGNLDGEEGTLFFGANNWFYGSHREMQYGKNPWLVAANIFIMSAVGAVLAGIWPISVTVVLIITYAKIARARFVRRKEFVDRLAGEHA